MDTIKSSWAVCPRLRVLVLGICLCFGLVVTAEPAWAADVIMNSPGYSSVPASSYDQPELNAVLVDPNTQQVLTYVDPLTQQESEAIFEAFIDTGSSGFVLSKITAGDGEPLSLVPGLGLSAPPPGDTSRDWTETGIGGVETGWVSDPYQLRIANGSPGIFPSYSEALYSPYDDQHGLWVRYEEGLGERILTIVDPLNIIGMPAIRQRLMVMDPGPIIELLQIPDINDYTGPGRMQTDLVEPDDLDYVFPQTNITFEMYLQSFPPVPSPPTDPDLSYSENPMLKDVTITESSSGQELSVTSDWFFDTGAGSSFISFANAQAVGLIDSQWTDVNDFLTNNPATPTTAVGGIGPDIKFSPILSLDEIRIPDKSGDFYVVWQNVDVLVVDIAGLDGVFGMNLLMPSVTVDFGALGIGQDDFLGDLVTYEEFFETLFHPENDSEFIQAVTSANISLEIIDAILSNPSFVECGAMIFDATDPNNVEFHMYSSAVPEPASLVLLACGILGVAGLGRRRCQV